MRKPRIISGMLACLGALLAAAASAEPVMLEADEAAQWHAVGRVNKSGRGFCTGTLVAPDRVLTAAHCLYVKKTKARYQPERVTFVAGWRLNEHHGTADGARFDIPQGYEFGANRGLPHDIAFITLDAPLNVTPHDIGPRPLVGDELRAVFYDRSRPHAPMGQTCKVLRLGQVLAELDCPVVVGNSGGPLFNDDDQIVAIVIAKRQDGKSLARLTTP